MTAQSWITDVARRKPPGRVVPERSSQNEKRRIPATPPPLEARESLAERARYGPYAKHKYHPTAYGLRPYAGVAEDRTYCDEHARFGPDDFSRIGRLLRRGIMAGLWVPGHPSGNPRTLWTVDDNGWIYELKLTNSVQCEYHGYPMLPTDGFAKSVLSSFISWASELGEADVKNDPTAKDALKTAQERYR